MISNFKVLLFWSRAIIYSVKDIDGEEHLVGSGSRFSGGQLINISVHYLDLD